MKIRRLLIEGLYGYLDKNIEFNEDVNLLVGINGAGKTTVLNAISWMLGPSLPHLAVNYYHRLRLEFAWQGNEYYLEAVQDEVEMFLNFQNVTQQKTYNRINVRFDEHPKKIINSETAKERLIARYVDLKPEKHELETWRYLFETISKPIIIGLDRNLFVDIDNHRIVENAQKRKLNSEPNNKGNSSPVDKVKEITQKKYSFYKSRVIDLNSRLNDKIMLSSFDDPFTEDTFHELRKEASITLSQVESLHKKVKDYFEETMNKRRGVQKHMQELSLDKMEKYFGNIKKLISEISKNEKQELNFFYLANISQFKKLKGLISEFEEFEQRSSKFYEPLRTFLETINSFFVDSAKKVFFDKESGELKYNVLTKSGDTIKIDRDISTLSSGEKQLLILFTYLVFNSSEQRIFIVDEPEISLHPKWQKDFLPAVEKLSRGTSQIIIATHSPNIVGSRKEYCKILYPYN